MRTSRTGLTGSSALLGLGKGPWFLIDWLHIRIPRKSDLIDPAYLSRILMYSQD